MHMVSENYRQTHLNTHTHINGTATVTLAAHACRGLIIHFRKIPILQCIVLYCTIVYCTVLCCTVVYSTVLYYTELYNTSSMIRVVNGTLDLSPNHIQGGIQT